MHSSLEFLILYLKIVGIYYIYALSIIVARDKIVQLQL